MKNVAIAAVATLMLGSVSAFAACTVASNNATGNVITCADGSMLAYGPTATFAENGKPSTEAAIDAGDVCSAAYSPAPDGSIAVKVSCTDATPVTPAPPAGN